MTTKKESSGLRRDLSLLDATMVNVGSVIGSGIFMVPATIAVYMDASVPYISVWLLGGLVSMFGALAVAELGAAMPRAGGLFVYLKEAYGPLWGFLYGWSSLTVINSASIAAIAVAFATYLANLVPLGKIGIDLVAVGVILLLTVLNCLGVKFGALIQNGFSFLKIGAILILVLLCFGPDGGTPHNLQPLLPETLNPGFLTAVGLAMISVLWSYDGWIEVTYAAGEVKSPQRNLPKAILGSMVIVMIVYLLINLAYMYVLPLATIAQSPTVAADVAQTMLGGKGLLFITVAVLLSTFGAANGFILGAARVYYAMAREKIFLAKFGETHPTRKTPVFSLVVQAIWSSVLVFSGTFDQLISYIIFASWVFYALSVGSVLVLRRKRPDMERPYRAWGYPVTPILFILFAILLTANTVWGSPRDAAIGLLLILSGIPVYLGYRKSVRAK